MSLPARLGRIRGTGSARSARRDRAQRGVLQCERQIGFARWRNADHARFAGSAIQPIDVVALEGHSLEPTLDAVAIPKDIAQLGGGQPWPWHVDRCPIDRRRAGR
jgi:anti-sigma factor RsiW